ncbi:hypothetical protein HYX11_02900 [Candidatus Woesearchaeota archaeon]|nr:hypothetical protein [Candidatus Woesearchaeota archaeon]
MSILELLNNPEQYRLGPNFRGSSRVFPVQLNKEKYIVKQPKIVPLACIIEFYYYIQDRILIEHQLLPPSERLTHEAKKLAHLNKYNLNVPTIAAYNKRTLVRQYLNGFSFHELSEKEQKSCLDKALETMLAIHDHDIYIGDAHVKNIFLSQDKAYWLDFDTVYTEKDKAKAADLVKFIYSTYTVTRNSELTLSLAELVTTYKLPLSTLNHLKELTLRLTPNIWLWFFARIPVTSNIPSQINRILTSS